MTRRSTTGPFGLELVRQWVDAGDGEGKVWIVLVGEPETCGFEAKAEARRIAVEWLALRCRIEELELVEPQHTLVDLLFWPAPTILITSPSGVTTSTSIGSGSTGPRTMMPGFSSLAFISPRP